MSTVSIHQPDCSPPVASCHSQERRWAVLIALLSLGIWAVLAAPVWTGSVFSGNDLGTFHYPLRAFYARCLQSQHAWDWCPHLFSGFYLTGEGQAGTYHPLHVLLYRFLPVGAAFNLEVLLSYPLLFAGMAAWLSRHLVRRDAILFGAALFTFSSFSLLHFVHVNAVAIIAHIPWLLWAYDLATRVPNSPALRHRGLLAIVLLTASELLLGYPQYVWFSLLAEAWYLATILRPRLNANSLLALVAAKLLGVLLAAVQLLPTFEAVANSTRQAVTPEFLQSGSWHPLNLVQLVAPYLFTSRALGQNTHELGLYLGAVPLLLIVSLLVAWQPIARSRFLTVTLGLAAMALLLAFGGYGVVYPWQAYLPLVGQFRFPCRALVLFELAAAVLAAAAWNRTVDNSPSERSRFALAAIWSVTALSLFVALIAPWLAPPDDLAHGGLRAAGPLLFVLSATLFTLAYRGVRWAPAALLLLAIADVAAYGLTYPPVRETDAWRTRTNFAESTALLDPWSISLSRQPGAPVPTWANAGCLLGLRQVDGYAGLEPAKQLEYRTMPALRIAAVRFVYPPSADQRPELPLVGPQHSDWRVEPNSLPFARLVTHAVASSDPKNDLATIDLESTALVDRPLNLPTAQAGTVELLNAEPGRIELTTVADTPQLLVLAESYHAGWQIAWDDQPVDALRVNGDFLGAVIPAGAHRVDLRFCPQSLRLGAAVTGLTSLVIMLALLGSLASLKPGLEI